jgi:hypothetical protein
MENIAGRCIRQQMGCDQDKASPGMHPTKRNYFFDLTQATFAYKNNHGQE